MAIWIKIGARGELIPEAAEGLRLVEKLFNYKNLGDIFITSLRDGTHMAGSFHPHGRAFDLRWPAGHSTASVREAIKTALGDDFDVVTHSTHCHVEFDPK